MKKPNLLIVALALAAAEINGCRQIIGTACLDGYKPLLSCRMNQCQAHPEICPCMEDVAGHNVETIQSKHGKLDKKVKKLFKKCQISTCKIISTLSYTSRQPELCSTEIIFLADV